MNVWDVGDVVTLGNCTAAVNARAPAEWEPFANKLGAAADPTTVTLTVTKPDGTTTVYTAGGTPPLALTRESIGRYWVDVALDQAGVWTWVLAGTGAVATSQTYAFRVQPAGRVSNA